MEANIIKVSKLIEIMGLLAHAVHSGVKASVDFQTKRVREQINNIVDDLPNRENWKSYADPQEVFIDPEAVHAFIKLQSTVATFITAQYHNNISLTTAAVMTSEGYLNKIREFHGLRNL